VIHSYRLRALLIALAFGALHLPFLPASLEDLDSINFALGIRDFDVARHQPHPPGYPVFILAAKALRVVVPSEAHTLSLLSIFSAIVALLAVAQLFTAIGEQERTRESTTWLAVILIAVSPLFWITASRPLSDMMGLAVALAVQAAALSGGSGRTAIAASVVAGVGAGVRSQVVWLTLPALAIGLLRLPSSQRGCAVLAAAAGYGLGVLVWAMPLMILSGGVTAYLNALFSQGAEDFTGVVMLWTTPTIRQLARAIQQTFVLPWAFLPAAVAVLVLAVLGLARIAVRAPRQIGVLVALFGPYAVFHLLFQETVTTRYALPLVIPIAYAAARGTAFLPPRLATATVLAFAAVNAFVATQALASTSSVKAPAFQLLDAMHTSSRPSPPVLAMHRRNELDLRRPIIWSGLPAIDRRLPSPPKHEWLEVVKYWNSGGRGPVWFVADPPRSDLALFKRQRPPARFRWGFDLPGAIGGVRPNEMDWYVFDNPDWYLGEGWAITPETAGVAREDGRGPSRGGSRGWIRRWTAPVTLLVGGRHLGTDGVARVNVAVDGRNVDESAVAPGFFLRMLTLPAGSLAGSGDYATVAIASDSDHLAIEQFDAQPEGRVVFGFDEGWNELEYNPATGRLWRWSTERATIRARTGGRTVTLRMDGELEETSSSRVTIRVGERIVAEQEVGRQFSLSATVPADLLNASERLIRVESSEWYVPAETRWRSRDQRHLGLKIYSLQLVPAS
jgi:hypothetical protein